jgi:hypothetical protein
VQKRLTLRIRPRARIKHLTSVFLEPMRIESHREDQRTPGERNQYLLAGITDLPIAVIRVEQFYKRRGALSVARRIVSVQCARPAPRGRLRTVPPELPRGSGDAALASPAVVPEFENLRASNDAFGAEKRSVFAFWMSLWTCVKSVKKHLTNRHLCDIVLGWEMMIKRCSGKPRNSTRNRPRNGSSS